MFNMMGGLQCCRLFDVHNSEQRKRFRSGDRMQVHFSKYHKSGGRPAIDHKDRVLVPEHEAKKTKDQAHALAKTSMLEKAFGFVGKFFVRKTMVTFYAILAGSHLLC